MLYNNFFVFLLIKNKLYVYISVIVFKFLYSYQNKLIAHPFDQYNTYLHII